MHTLARPSASRSAAPRPASAAAVRTGTAVAACGVPRDPAAEAQESLMTALMEAYRRARSAAAFDQLVRVASPVLLRRIRHRLRRSGCDLDEADVLQETLVNVYRYPDHFRCDRNGAFKAWSGAILENAIRRLLRRRSMHRELYEGGNELLEATPDRVESDPLLQASAHEDQDALLRTWRVLLLAYLEVFATLSTRERMALHLVEVERLRYRDVAVRLAVRPEALKMVVFRARKRVHCRLAQVLSGRGSYATLN